jgi:FkbM family methyltransferase
MKKNLRKIVSFFVKIMPAPDYVYNVILKPKPLRYITNKILLLIIPESVELPEGTLYLAQGDQGMSGALALGLYEKFEADLLRSILLPGMVVANIGANLGYYALIASKHVGEAGKILAFEPEPRIFSILEKNIGGLKNVELRKEAISDKAGEITLYLSELSMRENTIVPVTYMSKSVQVKTITLDSFIDHVDVVIMDIEGAEPFAFAGMKRILGDDIILLFELNPRLMRVGGNEPLATLEMLDTHGFQIYDIDAHEGKLSKIKREDFTSFVESLTSKVTLANLYCVKKLTGREIGLSHTENI